jgi:isocitrate dehydrogenase (NAD+)
MTQTITLIPGDGIGPEVTRAAVRAVEASGAAVCWEEMEAGAGAVEKHGKPLPDNVLESLRRTGVGLKGPIATPVGGGFASVNVALRRSLDLYVNYRPARALPGIPSRFADLDLDLVLFRENTEGLYSGLEHEVVAGVVESLKIITERASRRIARYAFEFARHRGRKKVTALHKANIMKLSDGLFLRCAREVAQEFPAIEYQELIIDNACMQLVLAPEKFDVLVAENLYGDIVSDLCAGLVGGLGLVPGANIGDHCAVFEAVHGSAPDIAGKGVANPTALMRAAVQMLAHIGEQDASKRLRNAIRRVYAEGKTRTRDIGGRASTEEFTDAVVAKIQDAAA